MIPAGVSGIERSQDVRSNVNRIGKAGDLIELLVGANPFLLESIGCIIGIMQYL